MMPISRGAPKALFLKAMAGSTGQVWQLCWLMSAKQFRRHFIGFYAWNRPGRDIEATQAHSALDFVASGRCQDSNRTIETEDQDDTFSADWALLWADGMKQPLKMARRLGLVAVGVSCGHRRPTHNFHDRQSFMKISECVCPAPPLADGIWFALVFSAIGFIGSLMAVSQPKDSAVFMSASGIGLLAIGAVILVGGLASPNGEAIAWALAGVALAVAAFMTFPSRGSKKTKGS